MATSVAPEATMAEWPLLPVLEWRPGATQFRTLKLAKPNMRQLNAASHGTNDARLGPSGCCSTPHDQTCSLLFHLYWPSWQHTVRQPARSPGGKCEDGGTLFSKWTGLPNIGTALGPPCQAVVTKYSFDGCPSPEIHHCPRVQGLAQAAPAAGTGRPPAPKSWPR